MTEQHTPHLWEVKHAYYCNDGNYYSNDCFNQFKSMADFLSEHEGSDLDYNYLIRWDWGEEDPETETSTYTGDDYYRNGTLKLYFVGQRKGQFWVLHVEVCRADEPAVLKYLQPRVDYMRQMWAPLIAPPPA